MFVSVCHVFLVVKVALFANEARIMVQVAPKERLAICKVLLCVQNVLVPN